MPKQFQNFSDTITRGVPQFVNQLLRQADTATTAFSNNSGHDYPPNNGTDSLPTSVITMGATTGLILAVIAYLLYLDIEKNCCDRNTPTRARLLSPNRRSSPANHHNTSQPMQPNHGPLARMGMG